MCINLFPLHGISNPFQIDHNYGNHIHCPAMNIINATVDQIKNFICQNGPGYIRLPPDYMLL